MNKSNESPEIQRKRREVNDAYSTGGGVQSPEYQKSFEELHDMNLVAMANQFRNERGLPPNAKTPYDPSPKRISNELAQRDIYTDSLRDITSALNDGRSVSFAGNKVLPCKDSKSGLRVHLINGASYPANSRDVTGMTIEPAPVVEFKNTADVPNIKIICSEDLPANEPTPFSFLGADVQMELVAKIRAQSDRELSSDAALHLAEKDYVDSFPFVKTPRDVANEVVQALIDGRCVSSAGSTVLPCKQSKTGLRIHSEDGSSHTADFREVIGMKITALPVFSAQVDFDTDDNILKSHIMWCLDSGWCFVYQNGSAEQVFRDAREQLGSIMSIKDRQARVVALRDTLKQIVDAGFPHVGAIAMFASDSVKKIFTDARHCVYASSGLIEPASPSLPSAKMKP